MLLLLIERSAFFVLIFLILVFMPFYGFFIAISLIIFFAISCFDDEINKFSLSRNLVLIAGNMLYLIIVFIAQEKSIEGNITFFQYFLWYFNMSNLHFWLLFGASFQILVLLLEALQYRTDKADRK